MKEIPKCECGNDCFVTGQPKTYTIHIPFTKIDIMIMDFSKDDYSEMCAVCMTDRYDEPYNDAYYQGKEDGYNEAKYDSERWIL